jgi:hypothetical protein
MVLGKRQEETKMRIKPWLWISAIVLLMGSAPVFTFDRNQGPDGRSRNSREAEKQYREYDHEKEMREADRERDKEWREYLKYRKRQYKEWAKANRWERDDFENYRRDRGRRYDGRYEERYEGPYDGRYEGQYGNWGRGNQPRDGACFYTDSDYRGDYFCINGNGRRSNVGDRYNDRISSIRVFGGARVVAYEHEGFGGDRRAYNRNVPNLGGFNDEITAIEVR